MKLKVSSIKLLLREGLLICAERDSFDNGVAGQLLAHITDLEIYYPDDTKKIDLSEQIVNLLAKCNDMK